MTVFDAKFVPVQPFKGERYPTSKAVIGVQRSSELRKAIEKKTQAQARDLIDFVNKGNPSIEQFRARVTLAASFSTEEVMTLLKIFHALFFPLTAVSNFIDLEISRIKTRLCERFRKDQELLQETVKIFNKKNREKAALEKEEFEKKISLVIPIVENNFAFQLRESCLKMQSYFS